jgi:hypothetical protein
MGGVGKTSLAARLVQDLAGVFERIYWRSLRDAVPPTEWLAAAIGFLSDHQRELPTLESERLVVLLELLRERRCLLVLDDFDMLFAPGQSESRYRVGLEGYGRLLLAVGESTHQSCILLTSREEPQERAVLISGMSRTIRLSGLSVDEGQALLHPKRLTGSASEWTELISRWSGNGLALKIVGQIIRDAFDGNIGSFLGEAQHCSALTTIRQLLADQIARCTSAELHVLHVLAVQREPRTLRQLRAAWHTDAGRADYLDSFQALRRRSLVEQVGVDGTTRFTLHCLVLEYLTDQLVQSVAEEISRGRPSLLVRLPLIEAQAPDYLRHTQEVVIGEAILQHLADTRDAHERLLALLHAWRGQPHADQGCGPGNVVNLLRLLGGDLRGLDLSHLVIRQAYLAEAATLAGTRLEQAALAEAFNMPVALALSENGAFLAAGTADGEVWVWRVEDRNLLLAIQGHTSAVRGLALSSDNMRVATGDASGTLRLWDAALATNRSVSPGAPRRPAFDQSPGPTVT